MSDLLKISKANLYLRKTDFYKLSLNSYQRDVNTSKFETETTLTNIIK